MPCSGDSSEKCGAAWFLNVYQHTGSTNCSTSTSPSASPSPTTNPSATTSPSATPKPSATGTANYNNTLDQSEWYSHGCAVDSSTRVLTGFQNLDWANMTVDSCLSLCEDKGYKFAGVEYGKQCYCGATLSTAVTWAKDLCTLPCGGDSKDTCGGFWAMEVYELVSSGSADCPATSATNIGNEHIVLPSPTNVQHNVPSPQVTAVTPQPTSQPPSTSGNNQVWAHHMVGNAYPYTQANWLVDIRAASAQGIDGFALNLGSESWQIDRAADAYAAAQSSGTGFKLFLSLDLTALGCWSTADGNHLVSIVQKFANHPNQAMHNGKVLVSTFAGSDCNFGTGSGSGAWQWTFVDALKNQGTNIFFVPSIFSDISTFAGNSWMDGELNWNSAWPMGNNQISTDTDNAYMNALGSKEYMAAVSPFFFTHFGADLWNKNWLYRGDDWMYCTRWEQLIAMRNRVKQVEILTWNDYGESSYIGPIQGALPGYSSKWVNGFDHQGLAPLTQYYATAYKTGQYPAITKDTLVLWSRPHAHDANANDYIGKPTGWDWTTDFVWAAVLATSDAVVTLTSGSNTQTFNVKAGLTKLKIANSPGGMSGTISRNGGNVATATINGQYTLTPATYNYNYYVGSS